MKEVRDCDAAQNSSEKPRCTRCENEAECQRCRAPRRHAIRARNQMTDAALKSTAAWLLFHLACARTTNVAHKRRSQNAGDSVLGDDAAQFVRGYSKQCQIKQTKFSGQTV